MSPIPLSRFPSAEAAVDQKFQVWAYSVSHQSLLLRHVKAGAGDVRIDVLFKGVVRINLPTSLHGLSIEQAAIDRVDKAGRAENEVLRWNVTSAEETGFVDALAAHIHKDSLEFFEPSPLWDWPHSAPE